MKLYFDGRCNWYISEWDLEKTRKWLIKEGELDEEICLEERDIKTETVWDETRDALDIQELGEEELKNKGEIGSLRRGVEDKKIVEKLITFEEMCKKNKYGSVPTLVASSEW